MEMRQFIDRYRIWLFLNNKYSFISFFKTELFDPRGTPSEKMLSHTQFYYSKISLFLRKFYKFNENFTIV